MPKASLHPWSIESFELGEKSFYFIVRGQLGSREVFRKTESRYVAICLVNALNSYKA